MLLCFRHKFKLAHEVNHWLQKPHDNLGLEVQAYGGDGLPLAILLPPEKLNEGDTEDNPEYSLV